MDYINKIIKIVVASAFVMLGFLFCGADSVMAYEYGLSMSPMSQNIIIDPGDSFRAAFNISNPSGSTQDTYYKIEIEPFYQNDSGGVVYSSEGEHGEIVNWVKLDVPAEGKLAPNEVGDVIVTIDVPDSAPAGGQYFSVSVTAAAKPFDQGDSGDSSEGATIKEVKRMSHLVYAEITGATIKKGEILDVDVPGFLLSGKITGSASVKNNGNVHGEARYVLKVFPLFSDEELYTNEENPSTSTILPDRTTRHADSWEGTPGIGLFNVVYTVEFEGAKAEISKLVIICPLWLVFVIIFAVAMIIMWLIIKVKQRKKE